MRRKQAVEERVTRVNKSENNKNDCQGTKMWVCFSETAVPLSEVTANSEWGPAVACVNVFVLMTWAWYCITQAKRKHVTWF
jgi:hypothetical protein